MKNEKQRTHQIPVGYPDLGRLIVSHRDAVVSRVRQVVSDALSRLAAGRYDGETFFLRVAWEVRKSIEQFRGFAGGNSGRDLCEFLEENFPEADLRKYFDKMERDFLLSEDVPEKKYLTAAGYVGAVADEVFSKLVRKLREAEQ